jgi:hypothetical protein
VKTTNTTTLQALEVHTCSDVNTQKQEGHDGPYIAHLNINTLHDKEKVVL